MEDFDDLKHILFTTLYGYQILPPQLKILFDIVLAECSDLQPLLLHTMWSIDEFKKGYKLMVGRHRQKGVENGDNPDGSPGRWEAVKARHSRALLLTNSATNR
ncbi:unnamed protein product, partial [Mesorhabditis belari]|uniref:Uncharacterized protein n=1 Tax=Mesorhabditis belari TaxID=2138241 RepID=A0AAF3J9M5_9BILA